MRSPADTIRHCAAALGIAVVSGCGVTPVPDLIAGQDAILVREIRRLPDCGTAGAEAAVTQLPDEAALRGWQAARGVDLIGSALLPQGPYALVEHGARDGGGHGLAVSRRAVRVGRTLRITASFLAPKAGAAPAGAPARPCVLVQLPGTDFERIELLDSLGKLRALSDGPLPVPEVYADDHIINKD